MEQEAKDDIIYWDFDDKPTSKERAKEIYNELMGDTDVMHELNMLLRDKKLKKLKGNA